MVQLSMWVSNRMLSYTGSSVEMMLPKRFTTAAAETTETWLYGGLSYKKNSYGFLLRPIRENASDALSPLAQV